MVDFSKLNDPAFRAEVARASEEQARRFQEKLDDLKGAVEYCLGSHGELSEKEDSFLRSIRRRLVMVELLSADQEAWLASIRNRLVASEMAAGGRFASLVKPRVR